MKPQFLVRAKNPSWYFVFQYPCEFNPELLGETEFLSDSSDPYNIEKNDTNPPPAGKVNIDFNPFERKLDPYNLPLRFKTVPNLIEEGKLSEEGLYRHSLCEMSEQDMNVMFFGRALEYLNKGELKPFLEYHFGRYAFDLNTWLDHLSYIIGEVDTYVKDIVHPRNLMPTLTIMSLRRLSIAWIEEKRKLLGELSGQPAAEAAEPELPPIELEKIAHKVVLMHELGIIRHLENLCKEQNANLTGREFGKLVGSILGMPEKYETIRKALMHYGHGIDSDIKSEKTLAKVRAELLKYRIKA